MWLHKNKDDFTEAVQAVSRGLNVSPALIEKDYYVTLVLKRINEEISGLIFKGGTSLSKCHKAINRLSEDIDLTLDSEHLTEGQRKIVKPTIVKICEELGLTINNLENTRSRRDYNCYQISYPLLFENDEIDPVIKAETVFIDSERTRTNYRFTPYFGKTYTEFINGRIKELGLSPRKDAVVMNSFVLGSDKTFFDGLAKVEQYNFFSDCYKFFAERYGEENIIAAVIHNDETTPHMHLNLMPITPNGRLCSKQLFDKPQLQQLQTDFYESVGKRWGLQRGKEGSQKKHLSTAEYKAKKIIEQADVIREENQVYADALTEAKNGTIPRKRGKLQEHVIALTAENNDLSKRLTKSMDETLKYFRKAETLQKEKDKNEKYVHAGKTLAKIAPNTYRGITYGMSSIGLFFSAFADFCTPSVQKQIPLLQKIEQEMQEEKERYERLNGKNGAHK